MFTNTIKIQLNNFSATVSANLVIKNIISYNYGYQYLGIGNGGYVNINAWNRTVTLPADISKYSSAEGTFYLDGKVDNWFYFYLNGNHIHTAGFGVDAYFEEDWNPARVTRGQTSYTFNLSQTTNTFSINIISGEGMWYGEIFSSSITITTISK